MVALAGVMTGALAMWTFGRGEVSVGAGLSPATPTTHGEWIRIANAAGDSMRAYVAYPERKDKAPAVIVIHEIFGRRPPGWRRLRRHRP
jgi:hypothetical protein